MKSRGQKNARGLKLLEATEILDLGCGPGQPALLIAKTLGRNARVHATDVQDRVDRMLIVDGPMDGYGWYGYGWL